VVGIHCPCCTPWAPLANWRHILFCAPSFCGLRPFGLLRSPTLTAYFWWEYYFWVKSFLFTPDFSGTQLGHKTRAEFLVYCDFFHVRPAGQPTIMVEAFCQRKVGHHWIQPSTGEPQPTPRAGLDGPKNL